MTVFGAFDLSNHLLQEFILAIYRFYGIGINLWILICFWNKKDFFIAATHEKLIILPTENEDVGEIEDEDKNQDDYNEINDSGRIEEVNEQEEEEEEEVDNNSNPYAVQEVQEGNAYAEI